MSGWLLITAVAFSIFAAIFRPDLSDLGVLGWAFVFGFFFTVIEHLTKR